MNKGFISTGIILGMLTILAVGVLGLFLNSPAKLAKLQSENSKNLTEGEKMNEVGTSTNDKQETLNLNANTSINIQQQKIKDEINNGNIKILQPQQGAILKLGDTYVIKWEFPKEWQSADIYLIPESRNCKNETQQTLHILFTAKH